MKKTCNEDWLESTNKGNTPGSQKHRASTIVPKWEGDHKVEAYKFIEPVLIIPPVHHPFYKELKGIDNTEDSDLLVDSDPNDAQHSVDPVCKTCQSFVLNR